jgi:hypothetical protein
MFAFLATLCSGMFAGAAGYVSLVEHWARLQAGPAVALAQFRAGFPRARAMQASLAVGGGIFALLAWLTGAGFSWLFVSLLLFGIVGFTLRRITPVYERLLDPGLTPETAEASDLLQRWWYLHHVRTVMGALAFLVALIGI